MNANTLFAHCSFSTDFFSLIYVSILSRNVRERKRVHPFLLHVAPHLCLSKHSVKMVHKALALSRYWLWHQAGVGSTILKLLCLLSPSKSAECPTKQQFYLDRKSACLEGCRSHLRKQQSLSFNLKEKTPTHTHRCEKVNCCFCRSTS